jgi:hypothetical protein
MATLSFSRMLFLYFWLSAAHNLAHFHAPHNDK